MELKYTSLTLALFTSLFGINYGQTCTSYTTEVDCNADELCVWSVSDAMCGCASTNPQDIMFVMDSSGSVGSSGWTTTVDFVSDLIETGVGPDSQIAAIQFSTTVTTVMTFNDDQDRTVVVNTIEALPFSAGWTYTKDALNEALNVYAATGNANNNDLLFLITDGIPQTPSGPTLQAVCDDSTMKDSLDAAGITVVIIAVGTFNEATISCLVDDTATQIIEVADFDANDFEAVRALTDMFLCPDLGTPSPTEEPFDDSCSQTCDGITDCDECEDYVGCNRCSRGCSVITQECNGLDIDVCVCV